MFAEKGREQSGRNEQGYGMVTGRTISEWLVRLRWPLLVAALVAAAVAWQPAGQVQFDRSIENMFRPDDPLLAAYQRLRDEFGSYEIVMAVYIDPQLLSENGEGITRLQRLHEQLQAVAGVREVLSLASVNEALLYTRPLRTLMQSEPDPRAIVRTDSRLAAAYRAMFEGYTHDAHGTVAALVCMLEPEGSASVPRRETIDRIRSIVQQQRQGMVAGEPVMVIDGFRYLEQDGWRLGWSTRILMALAMVACFGSLRWVIIPILVVQLTLLLTRATLVWLQLRLSMVSSMLTAIVTVVGVATVVHIIVRFRQARSGGMDQRNALIEAGGILVVPVFWACLTDAAGFLSLTVAHVGPIQDFGIMTAIGCFWVLLSTVCLVPALALWGRFDTDPHRVWGDGLLGRQLHGAAQAALRYPRALLTLLAVLLGVSCLGLLQLQIETDFTRNFRRGSPVVRSYAFIEERLGGAGVWDVLIPAPVTLDNPYLDRVRALQQELRGIMIHDEQDGDVPGLTKVLSLVDGIDAASQHPLLEHIPPELKARGMAVTMPHFVEALRTTRREPEAVSYLRIMLRAREQQSASERTQLIEQVGDAVGRHFPASPATPAAEVTGSYVLLTNLITSVLRDQWNCFLVAMLGVGIMMTLAFRSALLALIALVPNVLPILGVLGAMGWLGARVNMGAAMIAAVSMGLSVDSSIHYITSFQRARATGLTVAQAIADVQQSVGRAAVYATIALVVGFLALCTSQFVPTIYFGALVSLAMLGGLLGNVIILPLLLSLQGQWRPSGT